MSAVVTLPVTFGVGDPQYVVVFREQGVGWGLWVKSATAERMVKRDLNHRRAGGTINIFVCHS